MKNNPKTVTDIIKHLKTPGVGTFFVNLVLRKDESNLNTIILRYLGEKSSHHHDHLLSLNLLP
jgi:hypothetical protein